MKIRKTQVERELGCEVETEQFKKALTRAERKLKRIICREGDSHGERRKPYYLIQLTVEQLKVMELENFSINLIRAVNDMEKEHPAQCQSAQLTSHIVSCSFK